MVCSHYASLISCALLVMSSALFDVSLGFCINNLLLSMYGTCVRINGFSVLYNSDICSCYLWQHTSYLPNVDCMQCCCQCSHLLLTVASRYIQHFKFWGVINTVHVRLFLLINHRLYFSKLQWCHISCYYFIPVVPVCNNMRWVLLLIDAVTSSLLTLLLQTAWVL